MSKARILVGLSCLVLLPLTVAAQNNTPASAATYSMGQGFIDVNVGAPPNDFRWYHYGVIAGHSYCAEQVAAKNPSISQDGYVEVRREDQTTVIASGDDIDSDSEPGWDTDATPGRACYVAPATEQNVVQVSNCCDVSPDPTVESYQFRVIETTLYSPWFFTGNGFEAFILLHNTTNSDLVATVTLRSPSGGVLGAQTGAVNAHSSYNLQVSATPPTGFSLPNSSGTVQIAFRGVNDQAAAPGSLIASVTSLSFASGVSFDAPAAPRQDWQR